MSFIGLTVTCDPEVAELILAELSVFPFVAFEETEAGLMASCEKQDWEETEICAVLEKYGARFQWEEVEKVNWNTEWEKNYDPVAIEELIYIRASFHAPRPEFPMEIIITPKMSFGTGHHATTHQVLRQQWQIDHRDKDVLDVGCGTGVLSIMAEKRGARSVQAIDIDEWCVENSLENFSLNSCQAIAVRQGTIGDIDKTRPFDIVLANINKNVLLEQMGEYTKRLKKGGVMILSGFYASDVPELVREAEKEGLRLVRQSEKDRWAVLVVEK